MYLLFLTVTNFNVLLFISEFTSDSFNKSVMLLIICASYFYNVSLKSLIITFLCFIFFSDNRHRNAQSL